MNNYENCNEYSLLLAAWHDVIKSVSTKRSHLKSSLLNIIDNPKKNAEERYQEFNNLRLALISPSLNKIIKPSLSFRQRLFWRPGSWLRRFVTGNQANGSKLRAALLQDICLTKVLTYQNYQKLPQKKNDKPQHIDDYFTNQAIDFKNKLDQGEDIPFLLQFLQNFKYHLSLDLYEQLLEKLYASHSHQTLNFFYEHYQQNIKTQSLQHPEYEYIELDFLAKALVKKNIDFSTGEASVIHSTAEFLMQIGIQSALPEKKMSTGEIPLISLIKAHQQCTYPHRLFEHVTRQLIERIVILYLQNPKDSTWENEGLGRKTLTALLDFQNKDAINTPSSPKVHDFENFVNLLENPEHPHADMEFKVRRLLFNAAYYLPHNRALFINEFIRPLRAEKVLSHSNLVWIKSRVARLYPDLIPEMDHYFFKIVLHQNFPSQADSSPRTQSIPTLLNDLENECNKAAAFSEKLESIQENEAIAKALHIIHILFDKLLSSDLESIDTLIGHLSRLNYALYPKFSEKIIAQLRALQTHVLALDNSFLKETAPSNSPSLELQKAIRLFTNIDRNSSNFAEKNFLNTFRQERQQITEMRNSLALFMESGQNLSSARTLIEDLKTNSYLTDNEFVSYLKKIQKETPAVPTTACKSSFWNKLMSKVGYESKKVKNNPF